VLELGVRLAPTSVVPGWEWIYVTAYGLYALVSIAILQRSRSA